MKVLVTGSRGVIGRPLTRFLRKWGYDVCEMDIKLGKDNDILDRYAVEKKFERFRPDAVIHLAARAEPWSSWSEIEEDASVNIMGTVNVLEAMKRYDCGLMVFASSCAVYGDVFKRLSRPVMESDYADSSPVSPYGLSKRVAEEYIRMYCGQFGMKYAILRFGNVYSEWDDKYLMWRLFNSRERFTLYGYGKMVRDFVYVGDVCELIMKILDDYEFRGGEFESGEFNVGHEALVIEDIVMEVVRRYGWPRMVVREPKRLGEFEKMVLNCDKVRSRFSWRPAVKLLDEGIGRLFGFFEKRVGWELEDIASADNR